MCIEWRLQMTDRDFKEARSGMQRSSVGRRRAGASAIRPVLRQFDPNVLPAMPPAENGRPFGKANSESLIVGQAVLEQYRQLMDAQRERESLRESILEQLDKGAAVERGPLTAYLRRQEQKRFSADQLERLLGARQVEILRSQLEPIVTVQLIVELCSHPASPSKW
jgi:hypothetical protein